MVTAKASVKGKPRSKKGSRSADSTPELDFSNIDSHRILESIQINLRKFERLLDFGSKHPKTVAHVAGSINKLLTRTVTGPEFRRAGIASATEVMRRKIKPERPLSAEELEQLNIDQDRITRALKLREEVRLEKPVRASSPLEDLKCIAVTLGFQPSPEVRPLLIRFSEELTDLYRRSRQSVVNLGQRVEHSPLALYFPEPKNGGQRSTLTQPVNRFLRELSNFHRQIGNKPESQQVLRLSMAELEEVGRELRRARREEETKLLSLAFACAEKFLGAGGYELTRWISTPFGSHTRPMVSGIPVDLADLLVGSDASIDRKILDNSPLAGRRVLASYTLITKKLNFGSESSGAAGANGVPDSDFSRFVKAVSLRVKSPNRIAKKLTDIEFGLRQGKSDLVTDMCGIQIHTYTEGAVRLLGGLFEDNAKAKNFFPPEVISRVREMGVPLVVSDGVGDIKPSEFKRYDEPNNRQVKGIVLWNGAVTEIQVKTATFVGLENDQSNMAAHLRYEAQSDQRRADRAKEFDFVRTYEELLTWLMTGEGQRPYGYEHVRIEYGP